MDYPITIAHPPSVLAASIVYMTRVVAKEKSPWTPTLHHLTTYTVEQVRDCVAKLYKIHHTDNQDTQTDRQNVRAVTDKYMSGKYARVSKLPLSNPLTKMSRMDKIARHPPWKLAFVGRQATLTRGSARSALMTSLVGHKCQRNDTS
ncbi:hypothetical protein LEN26_004536 [Aphanomyces euteiches]|nr:hypothetical protein LEN26_018057 [Aphanomyces euteiches]KAH9125913.1 hypothetical protein AeMF1_003544 [Aphanomyces euteiches]KAH9148292.1 hypothetical protein LEN26_004536 [Aphanomyces euteiches]